MLENVVLPGHDRRHEAQGGRDPGPRPARPARPRRQGRRGARPCSPAASASAWPSPGRSANEPTLLLADEPTGALDTDGGREVLELFRRLHADGQTILMVTHSDEVAAGADRIVRMRDGRGRRGDLHRHPRRRGRARTAGPWRDLLVARAESVRRAAGAGSRPRPDGGAGVLMASGRDAESRMRRGGLRPPGPQSRSAGSWRSLLGLALDRRRRGHRRAGGCGGARRTASVARAGPGGDRRPATCGSRSTLRTELVAGSRTR